MKAFNTMTVTDAAMLMTLCGVLMVSAWVPTADNVASREPATTQAVAEKITAPTVASTTIAPAEAAKNITLPDFTAYRDVTVKKRMFFDYMLPMIREANDNIRAHRAELLAIEADLHNNLLPGQDDIDFVRKTARQYRVPVQEDLRDTVISLLDRVDIVPASLVLAQAASESGWGTSRFARQANNFFGVWCFTEGCGLTPLARKEGLSHEVRSYESVQHSIEAYMRTINSHRAYGELRTIRAQSRAEAQAVSGLELAEGLLRYSERGEPYVREIQQLIRVNKLNRFTVDVQNQT